MEIDDGCAGKSLTFLMEEISLAGIALSLFSCVNTKMVLGAAVVNSRPRGAAVRGKSGEWVPSSEGNGGMLTRLSPLSSVVLFPEGRSPFPSLPGWWLCYLLWNTFQTYLGPFEITGGQAARNGDVGRRTYLEGRNSCDLRHTLTMLSTPQGGGIKGTFQRNGIGSR